MADQAKAEIHARLEQWCAAANSRDFDALGNLYTENCSFLPHLAPIVQGRAATQAALVKVINTIFQRCTYDEMAYFELMNHHTAYVNSFWTSLDEAGKPSWLLKDTLLFKKINGQWYIDRDFFNERPLPKE